MGRVVELKLCLIGESVGVVLPDEVLSHLKVREGDTIRLVPAADGSVTVTVVDGEFQRHMTVAKAISERYRNTLRELAK
jgi:putative addiction module antidote